MSDDGEHVRENAVALSGRCEHYGALVDVFIHAANDIQSTLNKAVDNAEIIK